MLRGYDEMLDQSPQLKRLCVSQSSTVASISTTWAPFLKRPRNAFQKSAELYTCRSLSLTEKHAVDPYHSVINAAFTLKAVIVRRVVLHVMSRITATSDSELLPLPGGRLVACL
jgi:predicted transcriptional regulator